MRAIRNAIVSCSVITALIISQPAMAAIIEAQMPKLTKNMDFANLIVNIAGDTHAMKFNIVKK